MTIKMIIFDFVLTEEPQFSREPSVQFKEIQVNQVDKSALYNMPVQGF